MSITSGIGQAVEAVKSRYAEAFLLLWLLLPNLANWLGRENNFRQLLASMFVSLCIFALPAVIVRNRRALFIANAPWALLSGFLAAFIVRYDAPSYYLHS